MRRYRRFRRRFGRSGFRRFLRAYNRPTGVYSRRQLFTQNLSAPHIERKYFDGGGLMYPNINNTATFSNAGQWTGATNNGCLCLVPEGSGPTSRIGRVVHIRSMYFRYELQNGSWAASAEIPALIRVLIVYDRACNGALAQASDVLAADYTGNVNTRSMMNLNNRDRFKVLYDRVHKLGMYPLWNGSAVVWYDGPSDTGAYVVKFKKLLLPQLYNTTTGVVGSLNMGNIQIFGLTDVSATGQMSLFFQNRFRFTDG